MHVCKQYWLDWHWFLLHFSRPLPSNKNPLHACGVFSADSAGSRDPPPPAVLWSQSARYSQEEAVYWSGGYMYWEVSEFRKGWCKGWFGLCIHHFWRYGFVIAVTTIDNIGLGTLQPGRGFSLYPVKYKVVLGATSTRTTIRTPIRTPLCHFFFRQ